MNVLDIQNPNDPIGFVNCRQERSKLNLSSNGISSLENVSQLLKEGKYIPILKGVWAEQNKATLLEWLRSQPQIHAPLLAERAIAEFVTSPSVDTIIKVSLPLLKAAEFRTMQDCRGVADNTLGNAHRDLSGVYYQELDSICQKSLNHSIGKILPENKSTIDQFTKDRVTEVMNLSLTKELPSSIWVAQHGMNAFSGKIILFDPSDAANFKKSFIDIIKKTFE